jgi:hypothetical protein
MSPNKPLLPMRYRARQSGSVGPMKWDHSFLANV